MRPKRYPYGGQQNKQPRYEISELKINSKEIDLAAKKIYMSGEYVKWVDTFYKVTNTSIKPNHDDFDWGRITPKAFFTQKGLYLWSYTSVNGKAGKITLVTQS